jgi:predicted MFS family arabinose efflux permease
MTALLYRTFAQVYGAGSYNSSTYSGSSTTASNAGGGLTNTGVAIATIATVAAVLLLIAIVVRIWHRPNKNATSDNSEHNN